MHKREMVEAMLGKIEQAIERILDNSRPIDSYHYYLVSPGGMERLESTCMLLMAIGEGLKGIDKLTEKLLFAKYPEVDIIAHHYFDLDAAVVYDVVKNYLPFMLATIKKIRKEL